MARRSDVPTRGEVTEKVEKHGTDMREKMDEIEETVEDVETVRQTLEELDLGGTSEGSDAVEQAVEGAEDVSVEEFDEESGELEEIQRETEEHEDELDERSDTASSDLGKISDASGRIESDATNGKLVEAKESAIREIEFLSEQAQRARDAREESRRAHEERQGRVQSRGGS